MHTVITLCNSDYFHLGKHFINTRHKINAEFVVYGPDLTDSQVKILNTHDIQYSQVGAGDFEKCMQTMKFTQVIREINKNSNGGMITFVDFDCFFIKDWNDSICKDDFDLGVTVRNNLISKRLLRAYSNGGVIFAKKNVASRNVCRVALDCIRNGSCDMLPEYDTIWRTLEYGRKPHKTHYRTNHRWWTDQVFLSALVMQYCNGSGPKDISKAFYSWNGYRVGFYDCDMYNIQNAIPGNKYNGYIGHIKGLGGDKK